MGLFSTVPLFGHVQCTSPFCHRGPFLLLNDTVAKRADGAIDKRMPVSRIDLCSDEHEMRGETRGLDTSAPWLCNHNHMAAHSLMAV